MLSEASVFGTTMHVESLSSGSVRKVQLQALLQYQKGVVMNVVVVTKVESEVVYMFGEKCVVVTYYYSDGTTKEITRRCA